MRLGAPNGSFGGPKLFCLDCFSKIILTLDFNVSFFFVTFARIFEIDRTD